MELEQLKEATIIELNIFKEKLKSQLLESENAILRINNSNNIIEYHQAMKYNVEMMLVRKD